MKRFYRIFSLVMLLGIFAVPQIAGAHVLKQDHGVSSVMHIAPYDAPVSGVLTRLEFQFGNSGTFALNNYHVTVEVSNSVKTIGTYPIEAAYFGTSTLGVANINFPAADVYTLAVIGVPIDISPSFYLTYPVRVTTGMSMTAVMKRTNSGEIIAGGATILIVFSMFAFRQILSGKRYSKSAK